VVFRQERWQDVEGGTIEGRTEVTVDVELETASWEEESTSYIDGGGLLGDCGERPAKLSGFSSTDRLALFGVGASWAS
jgi:hypothetical protein